MKSFEKDLFIKSRGCLKDLKKEKIKKEKKKNDCSFDKWIKNSPTEE